MEIDKGNFVLLDAQVSAWTDKIPGPKPLLASGHTGLPSSGMLANITGHYSNKYVKKTHWKNFDLY